MRTAFITGASSGLGRALALHYAREGFLVHAAARRSDRLDALAAESRGLPGRIIPVTVDVTRSEALTAALRAAEAESGGALDLVIANAGVGYATRPDAFDPRAFEESFDVNARAACVTIAAALPAMVRRGVGTVVAVSSLSALRGVPTQAAYSATKAALMAFMEALRIDLRGTGVRAVTVLPGFMRTEMTAGNERLPFLVDPEKAARIAARAIARGDRIVAFPWQIAAAVRLLRMLPWPVYERIMAWVANRAADHRAAPSRDPRSSP